MYVCCSMKYKNDNNLPNANSCTVFFCSCIFGSLMHMKLMRPRWKKWNACCMSSHCEAFVIWPRTWGTWEETMSCVHVEDRSSFSPSNQFSAVPATKTDWMHSYFRMSFNRKTDCFGFACNRLNAFWFFSQAGCCWLVCIDLNEKLHSSRAMCGIGHLIQSIWQIMMQRRRLIFIEIA